jgi:rhamnulokinase
MIEHYLMHETYLAFDLGAESGRGIIAEFDGTTIKLNQGQRFSTAGNVGIPDTDGIHRWDLPRIIDTMSTILRSAEADVKGGLAGTAVDTWGVDYGLLNQQGELLENPVWYRDHSHKDAMQAVLEIVCKEDLWKLTGTQLLPFNTLFQLAARQAHSPELLIQASKMLFMPDLLSSMLLGDPLSATEMTIASTSQMLDPISRTWNTKLLSKLGLPTQMLQPLVCPGLEAGRTLSGTPVFFVAGHDTASAIAAVPADSATNWAYLSSGTWSLLGVERSAPVLTEEAFNLGFSNEIGVEGTTRLLKNIMGLWLVQECRRSLLKTDREYSYVELTTLAKEAPSNGSLIDAADQRFLSPCDMPTEIRNSCIESGQTAPSTVGELIRCTLDSLAIAYRRTLQDMEHLLDMQFDVLHIVGGGVNNEFLNQITADACGIPVVAGPSEATAAGNILCQLVASGALCSWADVRTVSRQSFVPKTYVPQAGAEDQWMKRDSEFRSRVIYPWR